MASNQARWWRWQAVAVGGLLVIVVLGVSASCGVWLASQVGLPAWSGWLVGLVVGFLASRAMTRRLMQRLMA